MLNFEIRYTKALVILCILTVIFILKLQEDSLLFRRESSWRQFFFKLKYMV